MAAALDNTLKDGIPDPKAALAEIKVEAIPGKQPTPKPGKKLERKLSDKPAIFMTGATHARELISTTLNYFELLQLI